MSLLRHVYISTLISYGNFYNSFEILPMEFMALLGPYSCTVSALQASTQLRLAGLKPPCASSLNPDIQ